MDGISPLRMPAMPGAMPGADAQSLHVSKISTQELGTLGSIGSVQPESGIQGGSFADMLGTMVREVNAKQATAGDAVQGLLTGENVPLHQAVIAMEEASISFQLMVEIRNKLVESYQELMRMQI